MHALDPTPHFRAMALNPQLKQPSKTALLGWECILAARKAREGWNDVAGESRQVRRARERAEAKKARRS